jgi:hypothetical protein
MNDLEFCKAGLQEIVARAAPDRLVAKVNESMTKRMLVEPLHRQGGSKSDAMIATSVAPPFIRKRGLPIVSCSRSSRSASSSQDLRATGVESDAYRQTRAFGQIHVCA